MDMTPADERLKNVLRGEVIQALLQMPSSLIEAYILAASTAPSLVHMEADPLLFLQLEKNVQQAALKLALYWVKRQTCFGPRAFLPMSQALAHQDAVALQTKSCLQRLPNDAKGCGVFLIDGSKIASSLTEQGTRCLFYQLHTAVGTAGLVFVFLASDSDSSANTTITSMVEVEMFFRLIAELVGAALPVRLVQANIISPPSERPSRMIPSVFRAILETSLTDQVIVTLGNTPEELAQKLAAFGLGKPGLPPLLGGTFGQQPLQISAVGTASVAPQGHSVTQADGASRAAVATSTKHDDQARKAEGLTKRKATSSDHVRDDSSKKIKGSATGQSDNKKGAAKPNHKTEASPAVARRPSDSTSATAEESVDNKSTLALSRSDKAASSTGKEPAGDENHEVENEEDKEKRIRKRNAHYSRRKYERKKIEIQVMKEQAHRLQVENTQFLEEQKRLEKLVADAKMCVEIHESGGFAPPGPTAAAAVASPSQDMSAIFAAAVAAAQASPKYGHGAMNVVMTPSLRELAAFSMLRDHERRNMQAASIATASRAMNNMAALAAPPAFPWASINPKDTSGKLHF